MLKNTLFTAVLALFICIGTSGAGVAQTDTSGPFQLKAKVMSIDLTYNQIVIAEEKMTLLSHFESGRTVWDTRFLDMAGNEINSGLIQSGSTVLVSGEIDDGTSVVEEIILME